MRQYIPITIILTQIVIVIVVVAFQNSRLDSLRQAARVAGIGDTTQQPYNPIPLQLPGKLQAEQYDKGGNNISYYDKTPGNIGQTFRSDDVDIKENLGITIVGWFLKEEWLEYTVSTSAAGAFEITSALGSIYPGRYIDIYANGRLVGKLTAPVMSTWSDPLPTASTTVVLPSGTFTLKLVAGGGDNVDLDHIDFFSVQTSCRANYDQKSETIAGQEIAVGVADLQAFGSHYRQDLAGHCSYDLIGNDCFLDLKDLTQFIRMYRQPKCGGL